jgi:hypothetical protein
LTCENSRSACTFSINSFSYLLIDEGPKRRTRERGSEWEPIKIHLKGDRDSNKMNMASNTRLRLTTQVGQDHAATGVLLALGTNNQLHGPENVAEHQPRTLLTYTGQAGEHHRSDRSAGKTWELPQNNPYTGQAGAAHRSNRFKPGNPKSTKQAYRAPN